MAKGHKDTGLFWSEDGQVACHDHTPYKGSDTWRSERWQRVPAEAFGDPEGEFLHAGCEVCGWAPVITRHPNLTRAGFVVRGA